MSLLTQSRSGSWTLGVGALSIIPRRHRHTADNIGLVPLRKNAPATGVWIRRCVAALLAGLAWLGVTATAAADPIAIYPTTTIYWASDFPFGPSTISGDSLFFTDARPEIFFSSFVSIDPFAGPTDLSPRKGPLWINPGETIFWSFGGTLTSGGVTYGVCADGDSSTPGGICKAIPIVTLMSDNFGSFSVTGGVFASAFGESVQIGTWEIQAHEFEIPAPATLSLLGLGLAVLWLARGRKLT